MTGGSAAIESGWVQVNQGGQAPGHSYGGYKQSGLGRLNGVSANGMNETSHWPSSAM